MYKNMAADHMQNIYFLDQDKKFCYDWPSDYWY